MFILTDRLAVLRTLLERVSVIDNAVYLEILSNIPAGLVSKLRLAPGPDLSAKLAHFLAVLRIAYKETDLGYNYEVLSIENLQEDAFFFDHDAMVMDTDAQELVYIDCTADPMMVAAKRAKAIEITQEHSEVDRIEIHVFNAKRYTISVVIPAELSSASTDVFKLFDSISQRPAAWRKSFFDTCSEVYDVVIESAAQRKREELDDRYALWECDMNILTMSKNLVQYHTIDDADSFERITNGRSTRIFYETFEKILSQQKSITAPCSNLPSIISASSKMIDVVRSLSANPIAATIHASLMNDLTWCAITESGRIDRNVDLTGMVDAKIILSDRSEYIFACRHIKDHVFSMKFSNAAIDDNFREQLGKAPKIGKNANTFSRKVREAYLEILTDYETSVNDMREAATAMDKRTIIGKMETLSNAYTDTSAELIGKCTGIASNIMNFLASTTMGDVVNHDYEVAKTFAASLKVSPGDDHFYVGINGPFDSITITKMTSTQDSFTTSAFFTIYRTTCVRDLKFVKAIHKRLGDTVQSKTRSFNKNTLTHALKLPFILVSLISWEVEHVISASNNVKRGLFMRICANSLFHSAVNSDQFSQCAEQIRYLFTSNIGLGASSMAICDKIDFIRTKSAWELLYLFRMLKLAAGLCYIFKTGQIGQIIEDKEFDVIFPNSVIRTKSFSYLVSSMYYANIYNKFRAFHEVSEAICYNGLFEEEIIYRNCLANTPEFVQGITKASLKLLTTNDAPDFATIRDNEISFCNALMNSGAKRFQMSILFVIGATLNQVNITADDLQEIYRAIGSSPIEACTMHGAMSSGVATKERQGIRAASSILEELIEETDRTPKNINAKSYLGSFMFNDLADKKFDFSIMSAAARQFTFKGHYRYRIVQKDQKGHREISVLNAKFRIGALLCEKVAHSIAKVIPSDLLDNPNKDIIIENAVRKGMRTATTEFIISDNSDQKRWGPNHLLHCFSAMYLAIFKDDLSLFRIINLALNYGECKLAKFPESLIDLAYKTDFRSKSEPISEFFKISQYAMNNNIFERTLEWGMCQGIFHRTSSLYHGIMCSVVSDALAKIKDFPAHEIHSFVTSDDAERLIEVKEKVGDRVSLCKTIHSVIINVGSVMNILRNESKSVFSTHITEFNSIFYHNGVLATPTLKQRISKIDIGNGSDPHLDMLTALSMSMGYFQNGGSYMGAITIMLLNIVLHTEQWKRWNVIAEGKFARPFEFGGFPILEPFSAMYCGPLANIFLRTYSKTDPKAFALLVARSTLLPAEPVKMDETIRRDKELDEFHDIAVYKSAGPMGVISISRTDKRLSQFEKRHKTLRWAIPDSSITLKTNDCDASRFIFNLLRITRSSEFEEKLGVNSFHIRMTDPWVNATRDALKLHSNSIITQEIFPHKISGKISYNEYSRTILNVTEEQIDAFYKKLLKESEESDIPNKISQKLIALMTDAANIYDTLSNVTDLELIESNNKNFIVKLNLQTDYTIDEEAFYYSLLKTFVGDKIKVPMIRQSGNVAIWDSIKPLIGDEISNPVNAIFHCGNVIQMYKRFVKTSTKLICPGDAHPETVKDLFTKIIGNKFLERYGIRNVHFKDLETVKLPTSAYLKCNTNLLADSIKFWKAHEMSLNPLFADTPNKLHVVSNRHLITNYDTFTLTDTPGETKLVEISAKGKNNFVQRIKMWISANVNIKLTVKTLESLLTGELTFLHEYALDNNRFIKNQTGINYEVKNKGKTLFEIQELRITGTDMVYTHNFFINSSANYVTINASFKANADKKSWSSRLINYINNTKSFRTNTNYEIFNRQGVLTDVIRFVPISANDIFKTEVFPNNLTIFLRHLNSNVLIPIVSQQISDFKDYKLDITYTEADLKIATLAFHELMSAYYDRDKYSAEEINLIRFVLFRSSIFTSPFYINNYLDKTTITIRFDTFESIDLFRAFILSNLVNKIQGNRIRVQHFFLNLFRSSPFYNNGVTSVDLDDENIKDEEAIPEYALLEDIETLDFNPPDVPIWSQTEAAYNDILATGILKASEPFVAPPDDDAMNIDVAGPSNITADFCADILGDFGSSFDVDAIMAEAPTTDADLAPIAAGPSLANVHDLMEGVMKDVPYIFSSEASRETPFEATRSYSVNRMMEICDNIVHSLKKAASDIKGDKRPRGYFGSAINTLTDSIRALSTKAFDNPENVMTLLRTMYIGEQRLLDSKIPISSMCVAELNFV